MQTKIIANNLTVKYIRRMPLSQELKDLFPIDSKLQKIIADRNTQIVDVLSGKSDKFLMLIGPCSADNEDALFEYTDKLARAEEDFPDLLPVPRVYVYKPRSKGVGYKGAGHCPDPLGQPNMAEGLKFARKLFHGVLTRTGMTAATEMLYPRMKYFFGDILGYVAIGARSGMNQAHLLISSGLDIPVGLKNTLYGGSMRQLLDGCSAIQHSHDFMEDTDDGLWEVATEGNPYAHCILRGYQDAVREGHHPNYRYRDLLAFSKAYSNTDMLNKSIIVDASHSNSGKDYRKQSEVALDVINTWVRSDTVRPLLKGLMVESYLLPGKQSEDGNVYGLSRTDSCMGWDESYRLMAQIQETVARYHSLFRVEKSR